MKFEALWILLGVGPGRFWARSAQFERQANFKIWLFLGPLNARFHRFSVGQILRDSEHNFENFTVRALFFQKMQKFLTKFQRLAISGRLITQ